MSELEDPFTLPPLGSAEGDSSAWKVVPNAMLVRPDPVGYDERERLRCQGRCGPYRGPSWARATPGLLEALPDYWSRPAELVLARADFEFVRGETDEAMAASHRQRQRRPDVVRLLHAVPWGW